MTGLLSFLMVGICYCFILFMGIWMMGWEFLLIIAVELGL